MPTGVPEPSKPLRGSVAIKPGSTWFAAGTAATASVSDVMVGIPRVSLGTALAEGSRSGGWEGGRCGSARTNDRAHAGLPMAALFREARRQAEYRNHGTILATA